MQRRIDDMQTEIEELRSLLARMTERVDEIRECQVKDMRNLVNIQQSLNARIDELKNDRRGQRSEPQNNLVDFINPALKKTIADFQRSTEQS
jgi:outer membrane murein-binding lipoprotein Lpp